MRVGLLEDDVSIQEMLLLVLQDEGYHVLTFPTAETCLDALGISRQEVTTSPVDIMLVDWRLNGPLTGIEVIKQIRQQPNLRSLPVILTTAATINNNEELQQLQISLLEKPFAVDDVIALIQQLTQPQ